MECVYVSEVEMSRFLEGCLNFLVGHHREDPFPHYWLNFLLAPKLIKVACENDVVSDVDARRFDSVFGSKH